MSIVFLGWTSDDRVPAVVGETKFGQGRIEVGSQPWQVLVTGNKIAAGSATADSYLGRIYSTDDADAYFGAGSEIARQCYAALDIPGVNLWAAPVADAAGTEATLTITIGGAWTATGALGFDVGRHNLSVSTAATIELTANAIADAINAIPEMFCTAAVGAGPGFVVTLTQRNTGPRGNQYYVGKDETSKPTGMTCAIAGGVATGSGLTPFSIGATQDNAANVIALVKSDEFDLIAAAQADATNAALWETHVDSEAGCLIGHLEELVFAHNGAYADAVALAQTTLNAYRAQMLWARYNLAHPTEISASWAAYRAVVENENPNPNYDDVVVPICTAQETADIPTHAEKKAALLVGLTPITTTNGAGVIVRSICTHCLTGTNPDYRCYDTTDVSTPDRIRKELVAEGISWRTANPYVMDDPDEDEEPAKSGVGTPSLWNSRVYAVLKKAEDALWIVDVDTNLPTSEWVDASKRIVSAVPVVVMPKNHQIGVSVRQQAY